MAPVRSGFSQRPEDKRPPTQARVRHHKVRLEAPSAALMVQKIEIERPGRVPDAAPPPERQFRFKQQRQKIRRSTAPNPFDHRIIIRWVRRVRPGGARPDAGCARRLKPFFRQNPENRFEQRPANQPLKGNVAAQRNPGPGRRRRLLLVPI